jgi:hypothetical protein
MTAVRHGVDGIRNKVRDNLHHLSSKDHRFTRGLQRLADVDAGCSAARRIDSDCVLSYFTQRRCNCRSMFAVVPERLLRDMGDASKFLFSGRKIVQSVFVGNLRTKQIQQIHDCFQRIINLVRNGRCHTSSAAIFSACSRGCSMRFRSEISRRILEAPIMLPRSSFTGEIVRETSTSRASLCNAHCLEMLYASSCANMLDDGFLVRVKIL